MPVPMQMQNEFYSFQDALKKEWEKTNEFPLPMWSGGEWIDLQEERYNRWLAVWRPRVTAWFSERGYDVRFNGDRSMSFSVTPTKP